MPRKRAKSNTTLEESTPAVEEEALVDLEQELEPEELESLEEEFEDEDTGDDTASAEPTEEAEEDTPEVLQEEDEPLAASVETEVELEEEEFEPYEEFEEVVEEPPRRETRQEMLGRLMIQLLDERENVHQALERVRDLKMQLDDAGPRPPEKLKEQYHKAIAELSRARRGENFARAELMQVLSWRG